ncbi:hypothetical protein Tco_1048805 [Tanacetum coccineum]
MVVHVSNCSTVDDVLDLEMLFETEGVGPIGKFKEVEHDEVFDDNENIVEDVHVSMNNFSFTIDPKHDLSIGAVKVQEDNLDVIDYDLFGSDLDDEIDSERRIQLRELRIIGKQKNKGPNKYYFYLGQQFATKERVTGRVRMHSVETRRKIIMADGRGVQDQMQKQFDVEVSKMKAFRAKRIATDKMTSSFKEQEILVLDGCFMSGPWPGQILTAVGVDANNEIYPVAYAIVEAESRAKCDILLNNICEVFNRQLVDGRYQPIITCLEYIREYLMKRIVVVQKVIAKTVRPVTPSVITLFEDIKKATKKWDLTGIPCKHDVAAIYNMSENSMGVAIPEQWVHAAYKLETWAHLYSFKVNPCNGREMWPVVESRTVIISPLYKPQVGSPPKKRNKSNDEIASQNASLGKLSRKGKSIKCGKYGNMGHNKKGYMGQGSASQAGGSSQAGARKVSGQAAGARNDLSQSCGSSQAGARKVFGQVAGARKASSHLVVLVNSVHHKA